MEAKNKRAIIVGIVIFLAILIFIAGVLTLGGQRSLLGSSTTIKAVFDDAGGLQAGNNVWYAGVKVGTIKGVSFDSSGRVQVVMNLEDKARPHVKKDAHAKVGSDGLIGNKIVVIYGGGPATPPVESGDVLSVQKALSTDDMMATLQDNNKNLLAITTDFKNISRKIANGEGSVGRLLNDDQLMNELQVAVTSFRQAASNTQRLSASVSAYTAKLQAKGSLANDLVTDTVIFPRIRSAALQIEDLSKAANAVVDNLKETTTGLNNSLNDTRSPVGALLHDEQTAENLKQTIENLKTSTKKLDENMEALQHNFLLRGFFKKKNKSK
jgi:phospholipid/cholesterol/gamma-HCH transport system substrate-binding protein